MGFPRISVRGFGVFTSDPNPLPRRQTHVPLHTAAVAVNGDRGRGIDRRRAALIPAAASAQKTPVPATTATSTQSQGMRYSANTAIGNGPAQSVVVTLAGTTFTIDDIVPIHAGTGCQPVVGDATKVTCVAYKEAPNGAFKPFTVIMSGGRDKARNLTAGDSDGAPMHAHGGAGKRPAGRRQRRRRAVGRQRQ